MRCETVLEQLSAHFDGELLHSLSAEINLHLAHCEPCRAEAHGFARLRELVGASDLHDLQPPPWAAIAERLQAEPSPPVNLPSDPPATKPGRSKVPDVIVIVASLAASILILAWTWQLVDPPTGQPVHLADSGHGHHAGHAMNATTINFQDTVSLQQQNTALAMQMLVQKYGGREALLDEVATTVGFKPLIQSHLPAKASLVSAQLLNLPQCNCSEDECMCGPGDCNCVACVCERPDGSTFLVIEYCKGQDVNFGDLPVRLMRRAGHELHVTGHEPAMAVLWTANQTRKAAFGLRNLNEIDQLLAVK